jgi:hypothetical protein
MGGFNSLSVVTAKAGTHNPWTQLLLQAGAANLPDNDLLWLWVPAFAGTTVFYLAAICDCPASRGG